MSFKNLEVISTSGISNNCLSFIVIALGNASILSPIAVIIVSSLALGIAIDLLASSDKDLALVSANCGLSIPAFFCFNISSSICLAVYP